MNLSTLSEELQKGKENLWGLIVYDVVGDGCVTGLWTNNEHAPNRHFMNESLKKDVSDTEIAGA